MATLLLLWTSVWVLVVHGGVIRLAVVVWLVTTTTLSHPTLLSVPIMPLVNDDHVHPEIALPSKSAIQRIWYEFQRTMNRSFSCLSFSFATSVASKDSTASFAFHFTSAIIYFFTSGWCLLLVCCDRSLNSVALSLLLNLVSRSEFTTREQANRRAQPNALYNYKSGISILVRTTVKRDTLLRFLFLV